MKKLFYLLSILMAITALYNSTIAQTITDGRPANAFASPSPTPQPKPQVINIFLSSGPTAGGTTVTITGKNFKNSSSVKFGNATGTVISSSDTQITARTPANTAGIANVIVTGSGGVTSENNPPFNSFTYVDLPTVTSVSSSSGTLGTPVTIIGTNFPNVTGVTFGGNSAPGFTVGSNTIITVIAPPSGGAGVIDVRVTNSAGTSSINRPADQFTYTQ